jgi:hypothetical protein
MSDLVFQNYNNRCKGWTNPSSITFGPQIDSLSGYYSPAGSTTLVSINGQNFFSYSTISFGTYKPTVYFINSNILQFYVPSTLNSGTNTVYVVNGSVQSNPVNYTIDNASGYWLLNSNGSISNTNTNQSSLVSIGALTRGAPTTINITMSPYTISKSNNWIICNSTTDPITITLPSGPDNIGRELMFKNIGSNQVISLSNNIIPLTSIIATSTILSAGPTWATLVYDGTTWIIMQGSS